MPRQHNQGLPHIWGAPRRYNQGAQAPLWTPAELTTYIWIGADSGVTEAGTVSAWADQSGNARNFSQGTAGNRPTYGATSLNGLPGVTFDGVDNFVSTPSFILPQPYTVFMFFDLVSPTVGGGSRFYRDSADADATFYQPDASTWGMFGGGAILGNKPAGTVFSSAQIWNGASSNLIVNSASIASGNAGTQTLVSSPNLFQLGGNSNGYSNFTIGEFLVLSDAVSQADRELLEGWAHHKYGYASRLPVAHPYKSGPPRL